jgi:hypothetical protein
MQNRSSAVNQFVEIPWSTFSTGIIGWIESGIEVLDRFSGMGKHFHHKISCIHPTNTALQLSDNKQTLACMHLLEISKDYTLKRRASCGLHELSSSESLLPSLTTIVSDISILKSIMLILSQEPVWHLAFLWSM